MTNYYSSGHEKICAYWISRGDRKECFSMWDIGVQFNTPPGQKEPKIEIMVDVDTAYFSYDELEELTRALRIAKHKAYVWMNRPPKPEDFMVGGKEYIEPVSKK